MGLLEAISAETVAAWPTGFDATATASAERFNQGVGHRQWPDCRPDAWLESRRANVPPAEHGRLCR